jgi:predicted dehydrogenase
VKIGDCPQFRIVHIGAGNFSRANHAPTLQYLAALREAPVALEGICDLDPDRAQAFCRDFGYAKAFTDVEAMLDEVQPHLVYCTVQPTATAGVLERVLPRGLPTFTEKPPGISVAQAERLAALAQEHNLVTYVAFNRRRMPGIERLKRWMAERGARGIRAEMLRHRRQEPEFAVGTAIHALDCLRYLGGDVAAVETVKKPYSRGDYYDYLVRLHHVSGVISDLAVLIDCGLVRERYIANAEGASMEVTLGAGYSAEICRPGEIGYEANVISLDEPADARQMIAGGFLGEHESFLGAARSGTLPDCCLQDSRHSMRLAVAVHEGYSGEMAAFKPSTPNPYE